MERIHECFKKVSSDLKIQPVTPFLCLKYFSSHSCGFQSLFCCVGDVPYKRTKTYSNWLPQLRTSSVPRERLMRYQPSCIRSQRAQESACAWLQDPPSAVGTRSRSSGLLKELRPQVTFPHFPQPNEFPGRNQGIRHCILHHRSPVRVYALLHFSHRCLLVGNCCYLGRDSSTSLCSPRGHV